MVGRLYNSTTTHTSLIKTHVIFNNNKKIWTITHCIIIYYPPKYPHIITTHVIFNNCIIIYYSSKYPSYTYTPWISLNPSYTYTAWISLKPVPDSYLINSRLMNIWINWSSHPEHTTVLRIEEKSRVKQSYQRTGCNSFEQVRAISVPYPEGGTLRLPRWLKSISITSGTQFWNSK